MSKKFLRKVQTGPYIFFSLSRSVCTTALDVLSALTHIPNELNNLDKVLRRERERGGERGREGDDRDIANTSDLL